MKTNKEILSSILKTTQMGQVGIRCVQSKASHTELKKALTDQLREYDSIEKRAQQLAANRGWQLSELAPGSRAMSAMMTRLCLLGGNTDSKIASMMIQGNTRGVIKSLKNMHRYAQADGRISELANTLLDFETANIRQMEPFL